MPNFVVFREAGRNRIVVNVTYKSLVILFGCIAKASDQTIKWIE